MAKMFGYSANKFCIRFVRATALATAFTMSSPVMGLITDGMFEASVHAPVHLASQVVVPNQTIIFKTL